jgi:rare lipoprotein A
LRADVALLALVLLVLAGCAGGPRPSPADLDARRDGPGDKPPTDLLRVPDASPRLETVRSGGPNKPYEVLGQAYTPLVGDPPLLERGLASWYGRKLHGQGTATGETYDMYAMTAAHKTMPLPSYARVRNPANGREVVVRVNDRGPFHSDRVIDLSYTAALRLGLLGGVAPVEVERITYAAIRTGAWRAPALPGTDEGLAGSPLASAPLLPEAAGWLADDAIAEIGRRADAPPVRDADAPAAPGFWLQLGAFGRRDGALGLQQRVAREVDWLAPLLAIFNDRSLHRLQAGPYASRADAASAAERVRAALQRVPVIVERH